MTEVGFSHNDVIQTVRGGIDGGTTWMHKTLAVEFSRWLSPSFSIWCNQKIEELLRTGEVSIRKKSPSKNRVDATMAWIKGVSEVFSLDDVSQQRMYNKFAEDYDLPLVEYTPANGGRDSISRLLKMNGIGMSAMVANKKLAEQGYLIQRDVHRKGGKVSHYYEVTEKGKQFGDNFQSEHNPKETQPLWYVDKFTDLLPLFQP